MHNHVENENTSKRMFGWLKVSEKSLISAYFPFRFKPNQTKIKLIRTFIKVNAQLIVLYNFAKKLCGNGEWCFETENHSETNQIIKADNDNY